MSTPPLPPETIAFIIDGEVVEILHTETRLAAILLSDPIIVRITDSFKENPNGIMPGSKYDEATKTFSN